LTLDSRRIPTESINAEKQVFFQTHAEGNRQNIYIGAAQEESSQFYIPVSLAIRGVGGDFRGVAVGWIFGEHFHDIYRSINIGKNGVIALLRQDGWLLARVPIDPKMIGHNFSHSPVFDHFRSKTHGTFESNYVHDKSPRISGFSNLNDMEFVVLVGRGKSERLSAWKEDTIKLVTVGIVIVFLLVFIAIFLTRLIAKKEVAENRTTEVEQLMRELHSEKDFANSLINTAQTIIIVLDVNGRILSINPYMEKLSGYSQSEVQNEDWFTTFLPEKDVSDIRAIFKKSVGKTQTLGNINPILTKNGQLLEIEWYDKALADNNGNVIGVLAIGYDITERKQILEALRSSEDRFRSLVESTVDWIWEIDTHAKFTYTSPRIKEILGYSPGEIEGKLTGFDLMPPEEAEKLRDEYLKIVATEEPFEGMINVNLHKDGQQVILESSGRPFFDEKGKLLGYRGIDRDITERNKMEQQLKKMAVQDPLTCLANRREIINILKQEMVRFHRYKSPICIFFIDIDHFKRINDQYSHETGDKTLINCANRMTASLRETDYVGRYGGEEFLLVLPETSVDKAFELADRLRANICHATSEPNTQTKKSSDFIPSYTLSIGISELVDAKLTVGAFINQADMAMYKAKQKGRNRTCIYSVE